jgi:hypothetical protein
MRRIVWCIVLTRLKWPEKSGEEEWHGGVLGLGMVKFLLIAAL